MRILLILFVTFTLTGCIIPDAGFFENPVTAGYRAKYLRENPDLAPDIRQAIEGKRIISGMSRMDVMAAWGPPETCSRVYGDVSAKTVCLYTDRARLVTGMGPSTTDLTYKSVYFVDGLAVDWQFH